jgi:hypothetical protein
MYTEAHKLLIRKARRLGARGMASGQDRPDRALGQGIVYHPPPF